MISLRNNYFMMIEPDQLNRPSLKPCNDDTVKKVKYIYSKTKESNYSYKGIHMTKCGKCSDNRDHILPNGMITNSLCVYYTEYYRDYIPKIEIEKINIIYDSLRNKNKQILRGI